MGIVHCAIPKNHQIPAVSHPGGFGNGILNFDSDEELRQASVQELKRSFGEEMNRDEEIKLAVLVDLIIK